jgi:hypothetical protein
MDHHALGMSHGEPARLLMSAEVKISAAAPFSIFSRIKPDDPNSGGSTVFASFHASLDVFQNAGLITKRYAYEDVISPLPG